MLLFVQILYSKNTIWYWQIIALSFNFTYTLCMSKYSLIINLIALVITPFKRKFMSKLRSILLCAALCTTIHSVSNAQGLAVNSSGTTADNSAMLDVNSTTKGALMPRMTTLQRRAISSPATGLLVYQTDSTAGFYYYDGSVWQDLSASITSQVMRIGVDGQASQTSSSCSGYCGTCNQENALRFDSYVTAAGMGNAPTGSPNFLNSITGSGINTGVSVAAGGGIPARTTDQIILPAGQYRVIVRLCADFYYGATSAPYMSTLDFKCVVNNSEFAFSQGLLSNPQGNVYTTGTFNEIIDLTSASNTLDFTTVPNGSCAYITDMASPTGGGNSFRSIITIERLK